MEHFRFLFESHRGQRGHRSEFTLWFESTETLFTETSLVVLDIGLGQRTHTKIHIKIHTHRHTYTLTDTQTQPDYITDSPRKANYLESNTAVKSNG